MVIKKLKFAFWIKRKDSNQGPRPLSPIGTVFLPASTRKCTISNSLSFLCILGPTQPAFSVDTIKSRHWKSMLSGLRECAEKDSSQEAHGETPLFFQKFSEKEFKPHHQRVSWSRDRRAAHEPVSRICSPLSLAAALWALVSLRAHDSFTLVWRKHKKPTGAWKPSY